MRLPSPGLMRVFAMERFTKLFGDLLLFVYHCFDRIVINGYLSGLSRPEQVVYFFRKVVGVAVLSKEILSQRTAEYQNWVEAFARNHNIPVEWAEKGVRKEDYVLPWLRRMTKRNAYDGVGLRPCLRALARRLSHPRSGNGRGRSDLQPGRID